MRKLQLRRLRFSKEADNWLRVLKARTGVTPNVLARMGYALSLEEPSVPDPSKFPEDSDREISRGTLLGEHEGLWIALLRQRLLNDGMRDADVDGHFRAHMNRGVVLLAQRMKSLSELQLLVPESR